MQIISPAWHPKSQRVNYFATDSLELHQRNLSERSAEWRYRSQNITYQFNSTGHRMREWTEIDYSRYIAVFGCSYTLGVGLALEETWAHRLAQHLEVDLVNCSEAGTTVESQMDRVSELFLNAPALPRLVIMNWPNPLRRTFWWDGRTIDVIPEHTGDEGPGYRHWVPIYQRMQLAQGQDRWQLQRAQTQLRALCQRTDTAYWQFTSSPIDPALDPQLVRPLHWPPGSYDLEQQIGYKARDVRTVKTDKQQRREGWPKTVAVGHSGCYHQDQILEQFWAAAVEIRWNQLR